LADINAARQYSATRGNHVEERCENELWMHASKTTLLMQWAWFVLPIGNPVRHSRAEPALAKAGAGIQAIKQEWIPNFSGMT
jgi:hypothetical protein